MTYLHHVQYWPEPGSIVWVVTHIFFRHEGVVSDRWCDGKPMVISNSTRSGGVTEEPWDVFANGQSVMENENPSPAVGLMRVLRARSKVGTDYSLFDWNCEHLVTYAQGKPIKSNQIEIMTAVLLLGGAIWLARSKR